jgi:hypothetical protein
MSDERPLLDLVHGRRNLGVARSHGGNLLFSATLPDGLGADDQGTADAQHLSGLFGGHLTTGYLYPVV